MDYKKYKIPNHLAIIMDGNGRWAKEKGLNRSKGHLEGSKTLKEVALDAFDMGVNVLSVFAFSTENFKRSVEEVNYLMDLFIIMFKKEYKFFMEKDVQVVFSGVKKGLPKKVIKAIDELEEKTKNNSHGTLNVCLNYGAQMEIKDMVKSLSLDVKNGALDIEDITEELIEKSLYKELPPIDLLIRTSGEQRLSNFMLWQAAYAEFYFPKVNFPDFKKEELELAIKEYTSRDRRFGSINYEKKGNE